MQDGAQLECTLERGAQALCTFGVDSMLQQCQNNRGDWTREKVSSTVQCKV